MSRERRVTTVNRGVRLVGSRWDPTGPGRGTVVLLHGGGQTRHSWKTTGRRLAAAGWAATAMDTRGHGESDWAPDGDYSPDVLVADLEAVVDAVGEPPVLVGASMGGMTSLHALGDRPGLARGLVLVDVAPSTEAEGVDEVARFMRSGARGFASLEEAADAVASYNPQRDRPPRPEGLRRNLRHRDGRWYWHWDPRLVDDARTAPETLEANARRAREAARSLRLPTMLVRGSASRVVSPHGARELLELVPGARHLDVEGAGHMVAGDDNDVFAEALVEFLEHDVAQAG
ncbi:alpha/beta fold hydrolase [Actinomycetospora sp. TBRC 11914]|uniref:alpha/beta fold hydrolase n=1 Tax=Actinomycetospora sp. TBRC 11914 TaxID=2729387 RepID=UPI00145F8E28|nr:alpha/beta hydrolase [Actinomycetospora sp. TBRC 11914]NMO91637.1 alpha/beta hydrolase [Actinomycetospora sp. TBRC 11914]